MKAVLPKTTLAQKVPLPKIESSAQTTDILPTRLSPSPLVLPSTSSAGDVVYETETRAVSTRFAVATTAAYDNDDVNIDDDVDTGAFSEGEERAFARKSIGEIACPYLSPYVHKRGVLDAEYGLRKIGNRFLWVIPMGQWIQIVTSMLGISILNASEVSGNYSKK